MSRRTKPPVYKQSPAYSALSPHARLILIDMLELAGKKPRRPLAYSARMAIDAAGVSSRTTASKALTELEFKGFIVAVKRGEFRKKGVATLWRLTMLPFGDDEPTHDYFEPTVLRRIRRAEDDKLRDRRAKRVEGVPFFGAAATEIYFVQTP
jgi:hypothetical protein